MKVQDRKSDIDECAWDGTREFVLCRRRGLRTRKSGESEFAVRQNFAQPGLATRRDRRPARAADVPCNLADQINSLRRYARALLGNSSDVEDLVQECLTRALERVRS